MSIDVFSNRDFGFGKQSLENTMNVEIDDMIKQFASQKGEQN